ncbi:hypothetical protein AYI69_g47 [Smittium culicis]|uniref:Uncharacterized protein n=1 Tax=Smittium culicis TaxID=133412 RepID=A0A1R1YU48_9FUNG|nr:hypothetical protein AYI69_g47 [Smittium culicis]
MGSFNQISSEETILKDLMLSSGNRTSQGQCQDLLYILYPSKTTVGYLNLILYTDTFCHTPSPLVLDIQRYS